MSVEKSSKSMNRRGFMKGLATAGGAAAASGLVSETANAMVAKATAESGAEPKSEGYRLTPHILEYYEKARF